MNRKSGCVWKSAAGKLILLILLAVLFSAAVRPKRAEASADTYIVSVSEGYLALRSAPAYDSSNEKGRLYSGEEVTLIECTDDTYWYVYSWKLGQYGYVNSNYLFSTIGSAWTVSVSSGYLALRTAKAYDAANEIGKLYTNDIVWVYDASDAQYWYVYSPKHDRYGYVNKDYLYGGSIGGSCDARMVRVDSGYLALRTAKAYDAANEIGSLYTGDVVLLLDTRDAQYWYVYAPKLGRSGYVNKDYLTGGSFGESRKVRVESGYLALRTSKAYDYANEIGKLYTGDTVQLIDTTDAQYWYVYAPSLGKCGFVNRDYLEGTDVIIIDDSADWTVYVDSGYLALRNAKAFDASNEIGRLYNGDRVQVISSDGSDYWYVYAPGLQKYGYVNHAYLY